MQVTTPSILLFLTCAALGAKQRRLTNRDAASLVEDLEDKVLAALARQQREINRLKTKLFRTRAKHLDMIAELPVATVPQASQPAVVINENLGSRGSSGVSYIRWGRTKCGSKSHLVYSGFVGGSGHTQGGGGNYLCMHNSPQWNKYTDHNEGHSFLYGSEYKHIDPFVKKTNARAFHDRDVPCAVCLAKKRTAKIMIPGRRNCARGWTKEYEGYLVTERHNHGTSVFECLDEAPETIAGSYVNRNGALMYTVEGQCGSLPCPKYVNNREITCVVCTK